MRVVDKIIQLGVLALALCSPFSDALAQEAAPLSPPPERSPSCAGTLALSALVPLEGYAERTRGMGISGGLWIELERLVVAPELTLQFDVEDPRYDYVHLNPVELGVYWLVPLSAHALFMGPGVGMNFWFERLDTRRSVGSFVRAQTVDTIHDDVFGLGVHARLGVMFFRSAPVRLITSVDYAITFADFLSTAQAQAVRVNVGVAMGGKGR